MNRGGGRGRGYGGKIKRKAVKRLGDTPVTLYSKSIVWQYFAAGKKKFSELRNAV